MPRSCDVSLLISHQPTSSTTTRQQHSAAVLHDHGKPRLGGLDQMIHLAVQIQIHSFLLAVAKTEG
jgi:hypothetical protein